MCDLSLHNSASGLRLSECFNFKFATKFTVAKTKFVIANLKSLSLIKFLVGNIEFIIANLMFTVVVAEITSVAEVWIKAGRGPRTAENNYFYCYMTKSFQKLAQMHGWEKFENRWT